MIVLFTDFGLEGPYTGQVKAVLRQQAPNVPVIDLFADAPMQNPKAAAYLLAAYAAWFPEGSVFLCVVDPGVGGERPGAVVKASRRWFVGPGNGLFEIVLRHSWGTPSEAWEIVWKPDTLSATFHGRDLFAPVAAMIASDQDMRGPHRFSTPAEYLTDVQGLTPEEADLVAALAGGATLEAYAEKARMPMSTAHWYMNQIRAKEEAERQSDLMQGVVMTAGTVANVPIKSPLFRRPDWPEDLLEIVYVDHYGNAMTGMRASLVPAEARLVVNGTQIPPARTFSDRPVGAAFWYENSNGLLEIAVNQGRADQVLGLAIGTLVKIA